MQNNITIEVVFALVDKQVIKKITVSKGISVRDAIIESKIGKDFLEYDLLNMPYGIFGKKINSEYCLQEGDRVEIYRPLAKTPNQRRLERASK